MTGLDEFNGHLDAPGNITTTPHRRTPTSTAGSAASSTSPTTRSSPNPSPAPSAPTADPSWEPPSPRSRPPAERLPPRVLPCRPQRARRVHHQRQHGELRLHRSHRARPHRDLHPDRRMRPIIAVVVLIVAASGCGSHAPLLDITHIDTDRTVHDLADHHLGRGIDRHRPTAAAVRSPPRCGPTTGTPSMSTGGGGRGQRTDHPGAIVQRRHHHLHRRLPPHDRHDHQGLHRGRQRPRVHRNPPSTDGRRRLHRPVHRNRHRQGDRRHQRPMARPRRPTLPRSTKHA